jgi:HCaRG protein.
MDLSKYVSKVNDWYERLPSEEQRNVLESIEKGRKFLIQFMQSKQQKEILDCFLRLWSDLFERLKTVSEEEAEAYLKSEGLVDGTLRKAIIEQINKNLDIYFDAKQLRDMDIQDFNKLLLLIIKDMFADRKFRTAGRLAEAFGSTKEEVAKSFKSIKFTVSVFYKGNMSFEDLEKFSKNDLGLSDDKIGALVESITKYSDKLERYFIFEQLMEIRAGINEISATLEQNK